MPVTMSLLITQVEPHQAGLQFHMRQTHRNIFSSRSRCVHSVVLGFEELGMMEKQAMAPAPGPCAVPEAQQSLGQTA